MSFPRVKVVSKDRTLVVIVASSSGNGLQCSVLEVGRHELPGVWSMILPKLVSYSFTSVGVNAFDTVALGYYREG